MQAMELVAEVMKDKLANLPRSRVSHHIWEDSWNKWATLLRIFLARTAADVAEFGKKAQGTVYATGGLERDQEWMCMQCGKWFPSRAACIGHHATCFASSSDGSSQDGALGGLTSIGRRTRRSLVSGRMVGGTTPLPFAEGTCVALWPRTICMISVTRGWMA